MSWLTVRRGNAPLILSIPHAGTEIPKEFSGSLISSWLARKDTDWFLPELYGFAEALDATIVRTDISRTVVDVNRDPSGASLYPGQATTGLCPVTTFDGEALYVPGATPDEAEIARRVAAYFTPYHAALAAEIARLKALHQRVVLYDCHSIRSEIPRLFPGILAELNLGTNGGRSCDARLTEAIKAVFWHATSFTDVVNGRFKGGWITRHYGDPANGVHAVQMELACRAYLDEPEFVTAKNWPVDYDAEFAAPLQKVLYLVLRAALRFGETEA